MIEVHEASPVRLVKKVQTVREETPDQEGLLEEPDHRVLMERTGHRDLTALVALSESLALRE